MERTRRSLSTKAPCGCPIEVGTLAELRARHVTAEKDIPERRLQLRQVDLTISGILQRIERRGRQTSGASTLRASVVGALRELIETRSGIEAALESAEGELSEVRRRLDGAQARLEQAGGGQEVGLGSETRISSLVATVAALRADDHAARRRLAARSRAAHLETLADRIRELRPWEGDVQQLVELAVPEAGTIERWKIAAAEVQKQLDRHEGEVERLTTERLRLRPSWTPSAALSALSVIRRQAASVRRGSRHGPVIAERSTLPPPIPSRLPCGTTTSLRARDWHIRPTSRSFTK